jgi:hypothetical protein
VIEPGVQPIAYRAQFREIDNPSFRRELIRAQRQRHNE